MKTIKAFLAKYVGFLIAVLKPLGMWGLFGFALVDSAFYGAPLDVVFAGYVTAKPSYLLWYMIMASAGSAVGSLIPYWLGWKGGEIALAKRVSKERFERIRLHFQEKEFWALAIPAMLPPPTPFKLLVFSAGVFEMPFWDFLGSIFLGRMARFAVLGILVWKFPQVFAVMKQHAVWSGIIVGLILLIGFWLIWRSWQRPVVELEQELEHKK